MKPLINFCIFFFVLCMTTSFAQPAFGDYMSIADGNWTGTTTWAVWDGSVWVPTTIPPTGTENITVVNTVLLDAVVVISGYLKVSAGSVSIGTGSIIFNSGSTYEHALNGGSIPTSTWNTGSTCLITGATGNAPGNANQNFYNFKWNCTAQSTNLNLAWTGITISGNVTCLSSGASSRFQFTNNTAYTDTIAIVGNVVVEGGTLTSNGSSGAQNYVINVEGNILVTGGNFSLSRGSGGVASWRLFGDLNVSNATLQTSNTSSKFEFASVAPDTQDINLSTVTHTSSWDYQINSGAIVRIIDGPDSIDLVVKKNFINGGNIVAEGWVQFQNGSNYQHVVNSSTVPNGIWETGSTATFTGITSQLPANRNQSYYNFVYNCPSQSGNYNMGFNNVTIGGDITILSTGATGRWYLCGPLADSTVTVTIMGDLIQSAGQVSSNGSGNGNTTIIIHQYGDIIVSNGNFSISRGSQGGTGITSWYLHGTNFSMTNVTTQNSNPTGAKFIFAGTTQQNLTLNNVIYGTGGTGGFPVEVATGAILDLGLSQIKGSGNFTLNTGSTLQTANVYGIDSTIQTTGIKSFSTSANYTFNGTSAQITGLLLPSIVNNLAINNSAGVTISESGTINGNLTLSSGDLHLNGNVITLDPTASLVESSGNTVTDPTGKIITTRNINAPTGLNVGGLGAMLTTSADLGSTIIERYHYAAVEGSNNGIFRVYNIQPTNNTGLNATLRFYYDESELNSLTETNLVLFKSPNGQNNTWISQGGIVNSTDNYVEMTSMNDFSYWTLGEASTTFQLSVNTANGWNMVSAPGLNSPDQTIGTWWAFREAGSSVYKFAGSYQSVTTVIPGVGYWMKQAGARTYNTGDEWPAGGIQIVAHAPLTGTSGWNMIGGYELSVTAANVTTIPPGLQSGPIYKFSGGYTAATTIDPGYGYWIKLTGAGQIIIPETLAKDSKPVEWFPENWGKIVLTDAAGVSYTLYAVSGDVDLSQYELPPAPMSGMFDIRYTSGRIAEDINETVKTIAMSGVTYPLTVRTEGMDMRLMDETGKTVNVNLKSGESVVINDATIQKLMVSSELLPTVYALEQNYPNPFNPSTVIEFSLPEDVSNVKLSIYNALGEKVAELVNTSLAAGKYSYQWNAKNVATGMYIYELRTDKFVSVKKMMLMK